MKWTAQARPADAASTLLAQEVRRAGYYPELVLGTLDVAVAGEEVVVDLVQAETTFDDAVHRHLTVLALTPSRLIIVHADDSPREDGRPGAVATSEAVPISRISSVSLTRGVCEPAAGGGLAHTPGQRYRGDTGDGHRFARGHRARTPVLARRIICMDDNQTTGGQGKHGQMAVDGVVESGLGLDEIDDDLLPRHGDIERAQHELGVVAGATHLLRQER